MRELVEKRRSSLLRQRQQLQGRLGELEAQRRAIEQEIAQRTADVNAVHGALQVCDSLLQELDSADGDEAEPLSLDGLAEALGADDAEFVPEE